MKYNKWRANIGCSYFYFNEEIEVISMGIEQNSRLDDSLYEKGNYFKTTSELKANREEKQFKQYMKEKVNELPHYVLVYYNNKIDGNDLKSKNHIFTKFGDMDILLKEIHKLQKFDSMKIKVGCGYENEYEYFKFDKLENKLYMYDKLNVHKGCNLNKIAEYITEKHCGFEEEYIFYKAKFKKSPMYNSKITLSQYIRKETPKLPYFMLIKAYNKITLEDKDGYIYHNNEYSFKDMCDRNNLNMIDIAKLVSRGKYNINDNFAILDMINYKIESFNEKDILEHIDIDRLTDEIINNDGSQNYLYNKLKKEYEYKLANGGKL